MGGREKGEVDFFDLKMRGTDPLMEHETLRG
jgi:hypothetical protein